MKTHNKKGIRIKIFIVIALFLIGFATIIGRAFFLQIIQHEPLASMANNGYRGVLFLPPTRGMIFDRYGHELAVSVELGSVYAHPKSIVDVNMAVKQLAELLGESQKTIRVLLNENRDVVWVKRRIPEDVAKRIQAIRIKGVGVARETVRFYPGGDIAGHLIGFVGNDNQGLEGIELTLDKDLRGPRGTLVQMMDARRKPFAINKAAEDLKSMKDIVLSIERDLQYRTQKALDEAVKNHNAIGGHCVVVDPYSGEILAMAVAPSFDPNRFRYSSSDVWRNRSITDVYEPGSVIKAFLLAAALNEYAVSPTTIFDCENGKYNIGSNTINDTRKHALLNVSDIVTVSSNIGAIKIGDQLGYGIFSDYLRRFGFSEKTDITLPGERNGFIRKENSAKAIDKANLFFGHGMTCTTLQLAMAMGAIANGGDLMQPILIKRIVDQNGQIVLENKPKKIRNVISIETSLETAKILQRVVSKEGTAPSAAIPGYTAAGKTGTAQKIDTETKSYSNTLYTAIFAGFAPAQNPKVVIAIMLDEPQTKYHGGQAAGPVFKEVGQWAMNHLKVSPQLAADIVPAMQDKNAKKDDILAKAISYLAKELRDEIKIEGNMPDLYAMSMRDVLKKSKEIGIQITPEGSGFVNFQSLEPGASFDGVNTITIKFSEPF